MVSRPLHCSFGFKRSSSEISHFSGTGHLQRMDVVSAVAACGFVHDKAMISSVRFGRCGEEDELTGAIASEVEERE